MSRGWPPWPSVGSSFRRFHRDARLFLVTTFVAGAAISLYYIDFNLYLRSLGFSNAAIGVVATIASIAGAAGAFPASAASDHYGRRAVIGAGMGLGLVALIGFLLADSLAPIVVCAAAWSVGMQAFQVVQSPFLAEHSDPEHRNSLFAVQFAIQSVTNVIAAVVGGLVATAIAGSLGFDPAGPATYRVILVIMAGLLTASLASVALLVDDRPRIANGRLLASAGEPAAFPPDPRRPRAIFGIVIRDRGRFVRLVLPGFLISLGAGQVLPFLNLFIQRKFGLDLQSLNAVFAFTSLGTMAAILAQPNLARRFGQVTSVVIVQTASIPFLVVLGFSPVLWTVILAMAVRNSLMNAGNPIFNAFAMEQVSAAERATLSATTIVGWQIGWVVGGTYYAVLQALLGFEGGYAINFVTIIVLYTIATGLYWVWFGRLDVRGRRARSTA